MPRVRQPNAGPYIVHFRYTWAQEQNWKQEECQTWKFACERMRALLVEGFEVKVSFT
jgi:hypothetical protein